MAKKQALAAAPVIFGPWLGLLLSQAKKPSLEPKGLQRIA